MSVLALCFTGCKDAENTNMKSVKFGVLRSHVLPIVTYEQNLFTESLKTEKETVGVEIVYYESNDDIINDLKSGFLNLCTVEDLTCIDALHKGLTAEIIGTYATFQNRSQPIVASLNYSMDNPKIIRKILSALSQGETFIKSNVDKSAEIVGNKAGATIGKDTIASTDYKVTLTNVKCANLLNATAYAFSNKLIKKSKDSVFKEPYDIYNYINTTYTKEAGLS